MNNGDKIRSLTNEEIVEFLINFQNNALYSGGENNRLLNSHSYIDLLEWVNKEMDSSDGFVYEMKRFVDKVQECYRCDEMCGVHPVCKSEVEKQSMEMYCNRRKR